MEEAFAPVTDDFSPGIQTSRDNVVGQTLRSHEDHFSPEHLKIR